jgi:DNA-binding transcriptional LysR family regulator
LVDLTRSQILERGPLVSVTAAMSDWPQWLQATGTNAPSNTDAGLRVDTVQLALDAAAHGLGIALGRRPLIDADLKSGRLVPAIDQPAPSGSWYWMITKSTNLDRPEIKLFRNWMLSELETDQSAK